MLPRRTQPRAFTLLELVMVMVIVCVVLAAAAPSFRGIWSGRRADDAAYQLLAVANWAQSQAVTERQVYRLSIDRQTSQYVLTTQQQGAFVPLGKEMGRVFDLPEDMRLSLVRGDGSNVDHVDFYPSGRVDPAIIEITALKGSAIRIVCQTPTEMFHIQSAAEAGIR
jgi:prepilin-type N-terminal cleavage/methylation domain-containing protein